MEKYPKIAVLSENLRGRTFEISKAEMRNEYRKP